jgi:hypothetical protein
MDLDPGPKIARQFCGNGPLLEFCFVFSREEYQLFSTVKNLRI